MEADNGEDHPAGGTDDELIDTLFACDEATLRTYPETGRDSFVFLVFGNDGWDSVNDYGVSLEHVMEPFSAWCEQQEEAGL